MRHNVEVVVQVARPTAVVAAATTWDEYPRVWKVLLDQVYDFLATSDVVQTGHNVMLYKDDVPNVEVGVEAARPFSSAGPVVASTLPAGATAVVVHRGGYDGLGAAHRAIRDWCAAHGRTPAGPRSEIYGDWAEDPADLVTEVHHLLA